MLDEIRKGLADAFKHRYIEDALCIACGRENAPLALHVIEFYHSDKIETPSHLVAMSRSRGTTRGSIPLCSTCCPPCAECGLPIATPWIKKLLAALTTKYEGITFVIGNGFCRHIHVLHDFKSLFRSVKLTSSTPRAEQRASKPEENCINEAIAGLIRQRPDRHPFARGGTRSPQVSKMWAVIGTASNLVKSKLKLSILEV